MMSQIIFPPNFTLADKRQALLDRIAELDATKRKIRNQIRENSNNFDGKKDRNFYVWLRKAKAKVSHLQEERDECRYMLGDINRILKNRRKVLNNTSPQHAQYFMAAAEELLDPEVFDRIEAKAAQITPKYQSTT